MHQSSPVLQGLSANYPEREGRLFTCYSPVRHSVTARRLSVVRLACLIHAASVRPEPGSNSPSKIVNYRANPIVSDEKRFESPRSNKVDLKLTYLSLIISHQTQAFRYAFTEPLFSFQRAKRLAQVSANKFTSPIIGEMKYRGDDLLSHTVPHTVSSTLRSLTSVFGMGTGVSFSQNHHK